MPVEHGVPSVVRLGVARGRCAPSAARSPRSRADGLASASAPASPEANSRAGAGAADRLRHAAPVGRQHGRAAGEGLERGEAEGLDRARATQPESTAARRSASRSRSRWNGSQYIARFRAGAAAARRAGPSPTSTSRAPVRRSTSGHAVSSRSTSFSPREAADVDRQRPLGEAEPRAAFRPRSARRAGWNRSRSTPSATRTTRSTPDPLELAGHEVRRRQRRPHHPAEPADVAPGELGGRAPQRGPRSRARAR